MTEFVERLAEAPVGAVNGHYVDALGVPRVGSCKKRLGERMWRIEDLTGREGNDNGAIRALIAGFVLMGEAA